MDLKRLKLWAGPGLYQQHGFQSSPAQRPAALLPRRLGSRGDEPHHPALLFRGFDSARDSPGGRKYRVAMRTGCAQDLIFSDINRDTVEVLARNGCEVITPPEQLCCGSLHAHNGEWELARQLARKQIDQFPPERFDAIITNAGGCGSHLKHYASLLENDPLTGSAPPLGPEGQGHP